MQITSSLLSQKKKIINSPAWKSPIASSREEMDLWCVACRNIHFSRVRTHSRVTGGGRAASARCIRSLLQAATLFLLLNLWPDASQDEQRSCCNALFAAQFVAQSFSCWLYRFHGGHYTQYTRLELHVNHAHILAFHQAQKLFPYLKKLKIIFFY